jgi:UDP-N-acetylmuramoyl-L-alanyl-D-glutamate--2,6-diaminopimelate ligase
MWQKIKNYYHLAQALISAVIFNSHPKQLVVIGVTGTDGKTTTVNMIYHILKSAGKKVSMISSVNAQLGKKSYDTGLHVSTPNPFQIQKYLKKAKEEGSEYFVIEATSHGLDQNRLAFVDFDVAVLTNITHDHLDYHKSFESYRDAKLKLFKNVKFSILNADDDSFSYAKNHVSGKIISYSHKGKGDYNLSNRLAAIAAVQALGIGKKTAEVALETFPGVKGRMEEIKLGQKFSVIIDFAHTPNGLKNALESIRSNYPKSRIIAVFGSAGQRDKFKRPLLGEVAARLADIIILTSEDPRKENPNQICEDIKSGIKNKKTEKDLFEIIDRRKAIDFAVNLARKDDVVAVFGKSHERSMNVNGKEQPWDEFETVRSAIKKSK